MSKYCAECGATFREVCDHDIDCLCYEETENERLTAEVKQLKESLRWYIDYANNQDKQVTKEMGRANKAEADNQRLVNITENMEYAGKTIASELLIANARRSMQVASSDGCKEFNMTEFTPEFRPIIKQYINNKISSVAAIYTAMVNEAFKEGEDR